MKPVHLLIILAIFLTACGDNKATTQIDLAWPEELQKVEVEESQTKTSLDETSTIKSFQESPVDKDEEAESLPAPLPTPFEDNEPTELALEDPVKESPLDVLEPLDQAEEVGEDDQQRNEIGELITLDENASLACANIEIGIDKVTSSDSVEEGLAQIALAAELAGDSRTSGIKGLSESLENIDEPIVDTDVEQLVSFLMACTSSGYEL